MKSLAKYIEESLSQIDVIKEITDVLNKNFNTIKNSKITVENCDIDTYIMKRIAGDILENIIIKTLCGNYNGQVRRRYYDFIYKGQKIEVKAFYNDKTDKSIIYRLNQKEAKDNLIFIYIKYHTENSTFIIDDIIVNAGKNVTIKDYKVRNKKGVIDPEITAAKQANTIKKI